MLRLVTACLLVATPLLAQQPAPIRGFPKDQVAAEVRREAIARAVPNRDTLRALMRSYAAVPHEAGTDRSRAVAERILARFRALGLDAKIEQFEALMPRPVSRTLELVAPERFTAALKEPALSQDPTSGQADQLPTFNAYSADGDVTGDLVYVNYGRPEDYHILDSLGVSVQGKIVIARYGQSWRGIKPKVAAEHGAIGCIIYSDPRDDGYYVDDPYPMGPMRPADGVQRGSVMDMPIYPGDPLSPGWGSTPGSRRLSRADAQTLLKIPVLPIGYGDALPLLRQLKGPVVPDAWRGGLPVTYHVGPGPARVHLAVSFDWQSRPLYDVIATIPGSVYPDQWIVYGNHHDAWVNGAEDPISGQVSLGETARALAALRATGWKPARTIILAAWDGEEWGLLGSTEWAEAHADELRAKAIVYYNSDTNGAGWLSADGSHSLEQFITELARDATDPKTGGSVLDAWKAHRHEQKPKDSTATRFTIGALGSGSDYTAFLDHLALPSANISYGGAAHTGIYHSIYDSYTFYERFIDTSFAYEAVEAQTMAMAILRMADATVVPLGFGPAARTYGTYVTELDSLSASNDTIKGLDLGAVRAAVARVDTAARGYERVLAQLDGMPAAALTRRRAALGAVSRLLAASEQALSDSGGLPRRPWFRHLIYAPGAYTGYGVKTMPGIREALDQRRADEARAQAVRVAAALNRYADAITTATNALAAALQ